jgi:hypothetical protein
MLSVKEEQIYEMRKQLESHKMARLDLEAQVNAVGRM